jgi:hypothetical protein
MGNCISISGRSRNFFAFSIAFRGLLILSYRAGQLLRSGGTEIYRIYGKRMEILQE